ncbi:hypothetical protein Hanom_Chr11g01051601 [Helianthus anomalus]
MMRLDSERTPRRFNVWAGVIVYGGGTVVETTERGLIGGGVWGWWNGYLFRVKSVFCVKVVD